MRGGFVALTFGLAMAAAAGPVCGQDPSDNVSLCETLTADPDQALSACTALIEAGPRSQADLAAFLTDRGAAYGRKERFDEALADLNRALAIIPDDAVALLDRGAAYHGKGLNELALADYNRAIALKPDLADAWGNRGIIYRWKGLIDEAIADETRAIALSPREALLYNNRGVAWRNQAEAAYRRAGSNDDAVRAAYDRSIADEDQAIALDPAYAKAYNNRGLALHAEGYSDAAIEAFTKAIALDARYGAAFYNRGLANGSPGEKHYDLAIADFTTALGLDPTDTDVLIARAEAYKASDRHAQALADLTKAAELGDANAQLELGEMYLLGQNVPEDPARAAGLLRKAAEAGDVLAQSGMASLYKRGLGVTRDYAQAYVWYALEAAHYAASETVIPSDETADLETGVMTPARMEQARQWAVESRAEMAGHMTPAQRARADRQIARWLAERHAR